MKTFLIIMAILLMPLKSFAQNQDQIIGVWLTAKQDAKVEIYKQNNTYNGKIIWLKEPVENGKPKVDKNNPTDQYKNVPLIGLNILKDFTYDSENLWKNGTIYDPKNGKFYSCKMTLTNINTLDIRGYIGISLFGRTETWTRTNK